MLRKFRVLILLALAALVWTVTPAYSTVLTTYTNLADWQAVTAVVDPTITFTGMTGDYSGTGLALGNVDFFGYTSSGNSLQVWDTSTLSWANFGTGEALRQSMNHNINDPSLPHIHVVFSTPVTAFGTDLFTTGSYAMAFGITVLGTQYSAPTNNFPNTAFWGVTSDTPISSVDFTVPTAAWNGNTSAFLDNFRYGSAQAPTDPEPEAATMLLIGSGLIGLAYLRKRIKPAQPV